MLRSELPCTKCWWCSMPSIIPKGNIECKFPVDPIYFTSNPACRSGLVVMFGWAKASLVGFLKLVLYWLAGHFGHRYSLNRTRNNQNGIEMAISVRQSKPRGQLSFSAFKLRDVTCDDSSSLGPQGPHILKSWTNQGRLYLLCYILITYLKWV